MVLLKSCTKYALFAVLFGLIIFFDRMTKNLILDFFSGQNRVHEIWPIFNLCLVFNTGISFGMLAFLEFGRVVISILTTLLCIGLFFVMIVQQNWLKQMQYCMIIAGAIGNLYDRIVFGGVVDFLDFHIFSYHWPAFNLADSVIFVGICGLAYLELFTVDEYPGTSGRPDIPDA